MYSDPENGRYQQKALCPYGADVELPAPVGTALDTEELKEHAH